MRIWALRGLWQNFTSDTQSQICALLFEYWPSGSHKSHHLWEEEEWVRAKKKRPDLYKLVTTNSCGQDFLNHWVLFYLEPSNGPQLPEHKSQTPRSLVPLSPLCFSLLLSFQFNSSSHTNYPSVSWTWRACSCHRNVALAVHLPETATSQISSQLLLPCLSSICSNVTFSWNPSLTTLHKSTRASSVLPLLVSLPCLISLHTQDFPFSYLL